MVIRYVSDQQQLIDALFEVAMRVLDDPNKWTSRESLAVWIRGQLKQLNFDTEPKGLSWGVLKTGD